MAPTTTSERPRRADAQRNHDRILAAARAAVAERGGEIVLVDIARDAGVGIGTLYRHFPTRQALLEATFLDEAQELRAYAEELADDPSPRDALVNWLRLQLDFGTHGRCMGAEVMNAKQIAGSELQLACVAMRTAGEVLLQRAQAAGEVRAELDLADVLRLIHGVVLASAPDPESAGRLFDLVVAGIEP